MTNVKATFLGFLIITILSISCKKKYFENPEKNPEKQVNDSITFIVDTPKNSDTFYVLLDQTFDYSQDHINQLNRDKPTKIKRENWDQIILSSPNFFQKTIDVQRGDTIFVGIKMDTLSYSITNKELIPFEDVIKVEEKQLISKIDSIIERFVTIKFSDTLVVRNEYSKFKMFKTGPNKNMDSHNKLEELKNLCSNYSLLINNYNQQLSEIGIKKERKQFLMNKIKRRIYNDLKRVDLHWDSKDVINCLESKLFFSGSKIMGPTEREYLSFYNRKYRRKVPGGNTIDYKRLYDSIPNLYNADLSEKARMMVIEKMVSTGNNPDYMTELIEDFNKIYSNKDFSNYINRTYLVDLKKLYNANLDVNIVDSNLNVSSLKGILDSLKGNIVYIDYWASWCPPCRSAMPASIELMNKYKDDDIVFVYFSIDKNKKDWLTASHEEGLLHYEHNYLILNHEKSNLKRELKIETIPRYLIFDKNGKLLHQNAPGPNTKEIKIFLNKYN